MQAWYYRTIAESLADLKGYDAYREYLSLVEEVFHDKGMAREGII